MLNTMNNQGYYPIREERGRRGGEGGRAGLWGARQPLQPRLEKEVAIFWNVLGPPFNPSLGLEEKMTSELRIGLRREH